MLKLKLILILSFIFSLILFYSCTDNPMNSNKAFYIESQTGKEICTTCWLVVYVNYSDESPVIGADVWITHLPENNYEYFSGQTNDDGVVSFYTEDFSPPEGENWRAYAHKDTFTTFADFKWDGSSYKEVRIKM